MSQTDDTNDASEKSPVDRTIEIDRDFKEAGGGPGGMSFSGTCGYHTYFKGDGPDDIRYATQTALHAAFDNAFQELWIGGDLVEDNHGEFKPETAAKELELQLQDFFRVDPEFDHWAKVLIEEFEDNLRAYQNQMDGS